MESVEKFLKIKEIDDEIIKLKKFQKREKVNLKDAVTALVERKKSILANLSSWDRVYLARHPDRPHSKDFIENIFKDFTEFYGDRLFGDDPAIIAGFAKLKKLPVCILANEKGRGTEDKIYRNFGMAHPEGYRKCKRILNLADKFKVPVVTFIDTPGAYPGIEAEERGQAVAIAQNLKLFFKLDVPVIVCVVGEGGSGGALAIGVGDYIFMLENAVYSVISPEGCASILWRDPKYSKEAARNLKLTSHDLKKIHVIDEIIKEPLEGLKLENSTKTYKFLKQKLYDIIIKKMDEENIIQNRIKKFKKMGFFNQAVDYTDK
ncbi:MAG: acetyl-CoA carboxylase carboxyltransferase subunit alpha [Candidatus Muiribacteriota bacterium]